MLRFKQFTLLEASVKDIIRGHVNNGHDESHVKEIIELAQKANKSGANIDITQNFNKIKNAVEAHKNKIAERNAIVPVHESDNIKVNRVDTKEACIRNYGGGKTNWCVAAKGEGNAFEHYRDANTEPGERNHMYTIHTPSGVYAYHEGEGGIARDSRDNEVSLINLTRKHPELKNIPALKKSKYGKLFEDDEDTLRKYMKQKDDYTRRYIETRQRIVEGSEKLANEFINHPADVIRASASRWKSVADRLMDPGKGMFFTKKPETSLRVLSAIADNHPEHAEVLAKHPNPEVRAASAKYSYIAEKLLDNKEKHYFVRTYIKYNHPDLWREHPYGEDKEMRS